MRRLAYARAFSLTPERRKQIGHMGGAAARKSRKTGRPKVRFSAELSAKAAGLRNADISLAAMARSLGLSRYLLHRLLEETPA